MLLCNIVLHRDFILSVAVLCFTFFYYTSLCCSMLSVVLHLHHYITLSCVVANFFPIVNIFFLKKFFLLSCCWSILKSALLGTNGKKCIILQWKWVLLLSYGAMPASYYYHVVQCQQAVEVMLLDNLGIWCFSSAHLFDFLLCHYAGLVHDSCLSWSSSASFAIYLLCYDVLNLSPSHVSCDWRLPFSYGSNSFLYLFLLDIPCLSALLSMEISLGYCIKDVCGVFQL